ncbi:hypothetical protein JCM3775_006549 [Rhodotorula graminis]|uniref:Uncharacterized protein n=1 Tax=Rhodotorula graminis (strain WP1) TaxID=578459 RepID=A0A0P9EN82_RHOGW|nr:uncharacterized protein RHOBADRAFT_46009 [Rhodotorula graminis WP1]KPV73433.1 hypothetical protein RHOBADRAFT_46009 [Rhodotorula graminis WP1]
MPADETHEPAGTSAEQDLINRLYEQRAPLKAEERALSRQLGALSARTATLKEEMQAILDKLAEYSRQSARASPNTQMVKQIARQLELLLGNAELPRGLRAPNQAMLEAFRNDLRRRQGQLPTAPRQPAALDAVTGEPGGSAPPEGSHRRAVLYRRRGH